MSNEPITPREVLEALHAGRLSNVKDVASVHGYTDEEVAAVLISAVVNTLKADARADIARLIRGDNENDNDGEGQS